MMIMLKQFKSSIENLDKLLKKSYISVIISIDARMNAYRRVFVQFCLRIENKCGEIKKVKLLTFILSKSKKLSNVKS